MSDDENEALLRQRSTQPVNRLTTLHHRSAARWPRVHAQPATEAALPAVKPPVLLVGQLRGLTPDQLLKSRTPDGPAQPVNTAAVDFRKAAGFKDAARNAVAALGFDEARHAEVRFVDSGAELLRSIKQNGVRQTIYLGHGGLNAALFPGGLDKPAVDEKMLAGALSPHAPPPILIGCFTGSPLQIGSRPTVNVIGLRRMLRWQDTHVEISGQGMHRGSLRARDIRVHSIDLSTEGKAPAPQAPLHRHEPTGPP